MEINYKDFLDGIIHAIKDEYGDNTEITIHTVHKPNETLEGMTIRPAGQKIAPTIYPEELYQQYKDGRNIDSIKDSVLSVVKANPNITNLPTITLEEAKKNLYTVLINEEANKELLADVPYEKFRDLAIVPRWRVSEEASFLVHDNLLPELKLTKEELLEIAQKNSEKESYKVTPLSSVLSSIMGPEYADDVLAENPPGISMYVVTTSRGVDGATALAFDSVMKSVHEQIGENVFILPSSRHELICVKQSECPDVVALSEMVSSVNATTVSKADFLSNSVYAYDGRKVSMASAPVVSQSETQTETQTEKRALAH